MAGPVLKLKPQMLKPQRVVAFKDENLGFRQRLKSVTVTIWYHVSCSFQFDSISSSSYLTCEAPLDLDCVVAGWPQFLFT